MSEKFYKMIKKATFKYKHVVEVGVYKPETANTLGFIQEGVLCSLFEADPEIASEITKKFSNKSNVIVYPFAITSFDGVIKLYKAGASSFCETIDKSPAIMHDGYKKSDKDTIEVEAKQFSNFDNGDIDILSVDVEGGEWDVIKEMKSRPQVISLEIQSRDYINPNLDKIINWLENNNYQIWFIDDTDTIFVKRNTVKLSFLLKMQVAWHSNKFFNKRLR